MIGGFLPDDDLSRLLSSVRQIRVDEAWERFKASPEYREGSEYQTVEYDGDDSIEFVEVRRP